MGKKKKLPRHILLKQEIKGFIYGENFDIGERLPGENELCQQFNVSRATLRKALDELKSEKLLERRRGSGTIILKNIHKFEYDLSLAGRLSEIIGENYKVTTNMIKITEKAANKKVAEKLDIKEGSPLLVYERVRSIDGIAAVYSIDNIAKERVPESARFENMGPSLSQSIGIGLHLSNARISPVKASPYICDLLNIPPKSLCLCLEEITYDLEDKPLDYSHEYYPENLFDFKLLRLNRDELSKLSFGEINVKF